MKGICTWGSQGVSKLCRDGTNTHYTVYILYAIQIKLDHTKPLSSLMIRKTHKFTQKKTVKHKSVVAKVLFFIFFLFLCSAFNFSTMISQKWLKFYDFCTAWSSMSIQCLHNFKFTLVNKSRLQHSGNCPLRRMPFSKFVHMHIHSLVLRPKTMAIGLRAGLVHTWNCELTSTHDWHSLLL